MDKQEERIKSYLIDKSFSMLNNPQGCLKYPYVHPGAVYTGSLWDWDSYWSTYALFDILELNGDSASYQKKRDQIIKHGKGSVLNFLDHQLEDGFTPILIDNSPKFAGILIRLKKSGESVNQHKPFLCQFAYKVSSYCGEYDWFDKEKLIMYLNYYEVHQYDKKSGLFIWEDDVMIGIDNNPTVFGRSNRSTADIYLNCFIYKEYVTMKQLLTALNDSRKDAYDLKANNLKDAIQNELYDKRDGIFYSADIDLKTRRTEHFHHGLGVFWNSNPIRIRFWGCFLPMMCGISTPEQNERMVKEHYLNSNFLTEYGIRTLSKDEKMYCLEASTNPSNWLGPIWTIATYCVFEGLIKNGYSDLAKELKDKTVRLLSSDIENSGNMSECYIPETGEPILANGFLSWNCLVASMIRELQ